MAYLAIYRKYRPDNFDKLIGQQHIVRTLTNQIKNDKVSHAYLFTGTRGTGKTSAARIFARAINCLHPIDGNPCNECEVCRELLKPTNMDIVEIDGASNNRVDEIRDLRERVNYLPSVGKYKVYIIDEVHMLTDSAYNALLKTLEEPPRHVVFILCTTEVQKMPATILSRCMRFDFKLVGINDLIDLMSKILDDCKVSYTREALAAVAAAGEGSVRDALSVLDRCVAFSDGNIKYDDVLQILGATDKSKVFKLSDSIFDGDVAGILSEVDDIAKTGKSISVLAKDVAVHIRDMLICKNCNEPQKILNLPADIFENLFSRAQGRTNKKLLAALDAFNKVEADLKYAIDPRVTFETVCLKVANDDYDEKIAQLEKRIAYLEKNGVAVSPRRQVEKEEIKKPAVDKDFSRGQMIWAKVLKGVRETDSPILKAGCSEIDGMYVYGDDFVLSVSASQNSLLNQPNNFKILNQLVFDESKLNLKFEIKENKSTIEDDIKNLEHLIGKDRLIVE